MCAKGEGSGEETCLPLVMGSEGVTSGKFLRYRCISVQFCAFLATSATENVQISV